jgi:hypothetical protein
MRLIVAASEAIKFRILLIKPMAEEFSNQIEGNLP